jgi:hypothetical protein
LAGMVKSSLGMSASSVGSRKRTEDIRGFQRTLDVSRSLLSERLSRS